MEGGFSFALHLSSAGKVCQNQLSCSHVPRHPVADVLRMCAPPRLGAGSSGTDSDSEAAPELPPLPVPIDVTVRLQACVLALLPLTQWMASSKWVVLPLRHGSAGWHWAEEVQLLTRPAACVLLFRHQAWAAAIPPMRGH